VNSCLTNLTAKIRAEGAKINIVVVWDYVCTNTFWQMDTKKTKLCMEEEITHRHICLWNGYGNICIVYALCAHAEKCIYRMHFLWSFDGCLSHI